MKQITVAISTHGKRNAKLMACLASLRAQSSDQVVIKVYVQADQPLKLPKWVEQCVIPQQGVSYSKNYAVRHCQTDLIAFTDDDCLADQHWIKRILDNFADPQVSAVYGRVQPYSPTKQNGYLCPSFMLKNRFERIQTMSADASHFGIGNNMAFRVSVLKKLAGFCEWLGPGKIGKAAEDVELLFRLLTQNYTAVYDPCIIIFHDRWISPLENKRQYLDYNRGMMAAYSYHFFRGNLIGGQIAKQLWQTQLEQGKQLMRQLLHTPRATLVNLLWLFRQLGQLSFGVMIGLYFATKRSLNQTKQAC